MSEQCPECGAAWSEGMTCRDFFHQMLFWENEEPSRGAVHHLMVLCFHLQHPGLYSAAGLQHAQELLVGFVEGGITPDGARRRQRGRVDSRRRAWTIKARPDDRGSYERPVAWTMTAGDVVAGGAGRYVESVGLWARSVRDALR